VVSKKLGVFVLLFALALFTAGGAAAQPQAYIKFDGHKGNYVEIPDPSTADFSVNPGVGLTVAARFRPDVLHFEWTDGSAQTSRGTAEQYVHWLGKGCGVNLSIDPSKCIGRGEVDTRTGTQRQEWTFRIYSQTLPLPCPTDPLDPDRLPCPRQNRISFYVFNLSAPEGQKCQNEGIGSYFQDPDPDTAVLGKWIHVVGVVDDSEDLMNNPRAKTTAIYKDGEFVRCDQYQGRDPGLSSCQRLPAQTGMQCPRAITPTHGTAPVRIGRRDRDGYFNGAIAEVRIWNRPLDAGEVANVFSGTGPLPDGLVGEYLLNEGTTGGGCTAHDTSGTTTGPNDGTVRKAWSWAPDPSPGC
jgi:hypothetical protein